MKIETYRAIKDWCDSALALAGAFAAWVVAIGLAVVVFKVVVAFHVTAQ